MSWNAVGDIANVNALVGPVVGGLATVMYQKYVTTSDSLLEGCRKDLEEVKARLNEMPPERREKIHAAAERGGCKSLNTLEHDLLKCSDDHSELRDRSKNSSYWERLSPLSQLRGDINILIDGIEVLRADTLNTTNFPNRELRELARSQSQPSPERQPAGPSSSPSSSAPHTSTTGGSQSVPHRTAHQSSGQPEVHLLQTITRPAPVHTTEGRGVTGLPRGLV